jgi:hypothetical protein
MPINLGRNKRLQYELMTIHEAELFPIEKFGIQLKLNQ